MSRMSRDMVDAQGVILSGFDYALQVWVREYIVEDCGHPRNARLFNPGKICCNKRLYAGKDIRTLLGREVRS